MKKWICVLSCILLFSLGCSGKEEQSNPSPESNVDGPPEIELGEPAESAPEPTTEKESEETTSE